MRVNKTKQAFTLIELLVVITIIGIVSTAALVVLKDTGEVKALQYTKQVMKAMKNGIAEKEEGRIFTGFLNDFGTMPPNAHFLLNIENNATFIERIDAPGIHKLGKYRITAVVSHKINDYNISMPFLDEADATDYIDSRLESDVIEPSKLKISAMYIGHHGGYIGEGADSDDERSVKDGWSKVIRTHSELNISIENGESFLRLESAGSDGRFKDSSISYLKEEFDEFREGEGSIEALYAEDYNLTYRKEQFIPRNMRIDLDLGTDVNETKAIIYSPMLYYAEGSSGETCSEHNTTHANCTGGASGKYIPYDFRVDHSTIGNNLSWHVGVIKYEFHCDYPIDNCELYINNHKTTYSYSSGDIDFTSEFYISAGEKQVVVLEHNATGWYVGDSFSKVFMPDETVEIK
ncbi:MAG: type II secretion system protein [Campylobacterales bacterium]|nr:type II secretion system protein [Campylobacterales bacterium]HEO98175.1 type II secretion system protein [Campylobacterota bacterium]